MERESPSISLYQGYHPVRRKEKVRERGLIKLGDAHMDPFLVVDEEHQIQWREAANDAQK